MPVPVIRDATEADAPGICDVVNAHITTTTVEWTETPHTVESRVDWIRAHDVVLVADVDGTVVGVAAFGDFRDSRARPGFRYVAEHTVHVHDAHQGTGLGQRLMTMLIERARGRGLHVLVAAIDAENEDSIRFHEQLGFVEVGRLPEIGEGFGRWLDLVLLQLRLDDRPRPD